MNRMYAAAVSVLLAGAVVGCHRTVNTVSVGESQGNEFRWVQTDEGLSQMAKVLNARKTRVNGVLKVQVEVLNNRKHDERIVYKWQWLDATGMEITAINNDWVPIVINGKESVMITGTAPDPRVVDARLKLQENVR